MKIPEQVLNTLAGSDVILIPPLKEGTVPTASELFVRQYLEDLMDAPWGLSIARDSGDEGDEMLLLFNPSFYDAKLIEQAALQDRLAEYVNGSGNNLKPENPQAMVSVRTQSGEPIRDILVETPEQAQAAISRNTTSNNQVTLNPADAGTMKGAVLDRIPNIGSIPSPIPESLRNQ